MLRTKWLIILLFIPFLAWSQENELRTLFLSKFNLKNQWNASIDGGYYNEIGHNYWTRWGIRGIIEKRINPILNVDCGFMYNYVSRNDGEVTNEYRPHQTLKIAYPHLENMTIKHRFRLEEQFIQSNKQSVDIRSRFRYEVKTKRNLSFKKNIKTREPYAIASAEVSFNVLGHVKGVNRFFERGRYGIGVGIKLDSYTAIEGTYYLQHSNRSLSHNNKIQCNIFNIQFIHTFFVK